MDANAVKSAKREVIFDEGRHYKAKIGYVVLAMEQTIEDDVYTLTPDGVGIHFSRIYSTNEVAVENLLAQAGELTKAASLILPGLTLDAVTYACTSGSFVIGEDRCKKLLTDGAKGAKATTLTTGVIRALETLNTKKIVVATPYIDSVNTIEVEYFQKRGLEILDIQGLNILMDEDMVRVPPSYIRDFAKSIDRPDAEAIFISCGALRSIDIIDELEQMVGKPVVTSNQALVWDALRLAGVDDKVEGYGRLFREF